MCGIVGVAGSFARRPHEQVDFVLNRAADQIRHRGPDGGGTWSSESAPVALGHRRLAVIDLSEAAAQPMLMGGGRYAITYNGELYNYLGLREELAAEGHTCTTASDTEVLLLACVHWGVERTLRKANGMFAFGFVDLRRGELWLARDRFGEKPLYWAVWDGSLVFASELKAMRMFDGFPTTVDRSAVATYFRRQVMSAPATVYEGVRQVRPGCAVMTGISDVIERDDVREVVYWDAVAEAREARATPLAGSLSEAAATLSDVLGQSIRSRMVSDVPLGAFLSGGIDSSTVVALMCERSNASVRTFTIGFGEDSVNEAEWARKVAAHLGTDHTEFVVAADDALNIIPRLPTMYDEPFADSSQIPTHLVAALARQHVTVALSGDGGDELFGGYSRYFLAGQLWSRALRVPPRMRRGIAAGIQAVTPDRLTNFARLTRATRFVGGGNVGDRAHKLAGLLHSRNEADLYELLVTHWTESVVLGADAMPGSLEPGLTFTEQMMVRDTISYLPDDILTKVDRAAMAVSLETRIPMLDPQVYRLAWSLPLEHKVVAGKGKMVLREVLKQRLPQQLWDRPKMGFGVPLDSWLRHELREWAEELLAPGTLRDQGYLNAELISTRWREHLSGDRNWQHQLWDVLMFQGWLAASKDGSP